MKLITIIKIFEKILSKKERQLSEKYGEFGNKNTKHVELKHLREILNQIDMFVYEQTGDRTIRHYRYFEFKLD